MAKLLIFNLTCRQFHQRFLHALFVQIFGAMLHFSLAPKICTKNARKKCCWNWHLIKRFLISFINFSILAFSVGTECLQSDKSLLNIINICSIYKVARKLNYLFCTFTSEKEIQRALVTRDRYGPKKWLPLNDFTCTVPGI